MSDVPREPEWMAESIFGPIRVPMPDRRSAFVREGDVSVSAQPFDRMKVGRRFNFDVSEEVLSKAAGIALQYAIEDMAHSVANQYRPEVERAVFNLLTDKMNREWVEPIIERITLGVFFTMLQEAARERLERDPGGRYAEAARERERDDTDDPPPPESALPTNPSED